MGDRTVIAMQRAPLIVDEAGADDLPQVLALRQAHERDFVGAVAVPPGITWFVAREGERVVACVALGAGPQRRVIVTDCYDDGSRTGKRGLVALFDALARARAKLLIVVPLDRPGLVRAAVRRGATITAWSMEYSDDER
jgi:hypothetical protein